MIFKGSFGSFKAVYFSEKPLSVPESSEKNLMHILLLIDVMMLWGISSPQYSEYGFPESSLQPPNAIRRKSPSHELSDFFDPFIANLKETELNSCSNQYHLFIDFDL